MKHQQNLSDALEDYVRFRKSMDIAPGTLRREKSVLMQFLAASGNIWVHAIDSSHVTRYFEQASKTKQPQSLRNDFSVLSTLFDWARETGRMSRDNNPLYGRRKPRGIKRERNRIHVSKFSQLLDAAEARCPRDRAAVALLLYTLGRDGEITDLRVRDVDLDAGYIRYRVHKSKMEDRMPICSELDSELRKWMTTYSEEVGFLESHYFLVPSRDTTGIFDPETKQIVGAEHKWYVPERRVPALGKIVTPILVDIGFPTRDENNKPMGEGAHTVRRSGARALFDRLSAEGVDYSLRIVQSMLHHADMKTTQMYVGLEPDRRTRDDLIKGRSMYGVPEVARLHRETA